MNQEIQILEVLRDLEDAEFQTFKKILSQEEVRASSWSLPSTSREDITNQLLKYYGSGARNVVAQILHHVPALHLLEKLGELRLEDTLQGQQSSIPCTRRQPPIGLAEPVVSQQKLMKLSQLLGHEWQTLGIMCLGLQQHQLERLEEDNPSSTTMRIFSMFQLWRNQEREKATVTRLYQLLSQGSIPISPEALNVLLERT